MSSDESNPSETENGEDSDEGSDERVDRKAAGTHVVSELSNDYFTFIDNRGYDNVRVLLRQRFVGDLGETNKSKTLAPHLVGDLRARPVRAFLVLRAWAVNRFQHNDFHLTKSIRNNFWRREVETLKAAILSQPLVGEPSTGNLVADNMIHQLAPEVL